MDKNLTEELLYAMFRFKKSGLSFSSQFNIRIGEFYMMKNILENSQDAKNTYVLDIQDNLYVTKPAVSQMLNSLENKGYIKREINKSDRRKIVITLTEDGKKILEKMQNNVDNVIGEIILRFGEEDTEQLIKLINRFADISEQTENGEGK